MSAKNENLDFSLPPFSFQEDASIVSFSFTLLRACDSNTLIKGFGALLARYSGHNRFMMGSLLIEIDLDKTFKKWLKKDLEVRPLPKSSPSMIAIQFEEGDPSGQFFTLSCTPGEAKTHCVLSSSKVSQNYLERMGANFLYYLEGLLAKPKVPMGTLPFVSPEESDLVTKVWNETTSNYPREKSLVDLFESSAQDYQDLIALEAMGQTMTYQELNEKANQAAHFLQSLGVQKGDFVGVSLERSFELIIGILAILKVGAAYVPINPSYPEEQKQFMTQNAGIKRVLTKGFLKCSESKEALAIKRHPLDIAMVQYTSGSTGVPKGVVVPHRGIIRFVKNTNWIEVQPQDHLLHLADVSFDAACFEIWTALLNGATLHIYPESEIEVEGLEAFMRAKEISHALLTARLFNLFVQNLSSPLDSLRFLASVGEAMSAQHAQLALVKFPQCSIVNGYGPSENSVITTSYLVKNLEEVGETIPIGRPVSNTQVYLLDPYLQPVPIGVKGELYVAGDGVTLGYLNQKEQTEERFIPNPFGPGQLYRTGDLAYYLPDGNMEYVGRSDNQVKIRGYRVELGAIETVLVQHEKVIDCIVKVHEQQIAAYVQSKTDLSPDELKSYMASRFPSFMTPSFYVILESFPLKPNGKVDLKALPNPVEAAQQERAFEAPQSATEKILAKEWEDLFHLSKVGRHDHFLQLGGDSISAAQLAAFLRTETGKDVPLSAISQNPILSDLAHWVEHTATPISSDDLIVKREVHTPSPLSYNQESLWILHKMNPSSRAYLESFSFKIEGEVHIFHLKTALDQLIQRHESLRTTFEEVKGEVYAHIHEKCEGAFIYEKAPSEEAAYARFQEMADASIDLSKLPLFRFVIIEVAHQVYLCCGFVHHIIFDGWSTHILFQEWEALYQSLVEGHEPSLPHLPLQYPDYALWQREFATSDAMEKQLHYWVEKLADAPELLELPWDRPRPSVFTEKGDFYFFDVDKTIKEAATKTARALGVTVFELLFSSFLAYLYRLSGKDDFVAFTPYANRSRSGVENVIGYFIQMLMVRPQMKKELTFTQLLKKTAEELAQGYQNAEVPLERIIKALNPSRNPSYNPLFQSGFSLETAVRKLQLKGVKTSLIPWCIQATKFDLYLALIEEKEQFRGYVNYSTDLFKEETIQRFVGNFQVFLEAICKDPTQLVDDLPVMTPEELNRTVYQWNETARDYPRETSLPDLFQQTVKEHGARLAAQCLNEKMTYEELNAQANQVARHLQHLGIKKGDAVGIFLDRSIDLLVSILAILKVGGIYLPVNADYPDERKAFMLNDANAKWILTTLGYQKAFSVKDLQFLCMDLEKDTFSKYSTENLNVATAALDVSMLYYTSGSTGKPKGVEVYHRGVVRLVKNVDWVQITPDDRFLHISDVSFDAATFEIWGALLNGASVHIYPYKEISIQQLEPIVIEQKVTHALLTARLFNLLVDHHTVPLESFCYLLSAGEAMSPLHAKKALKSFPNCHIINIYGPTENSVVAVTYEVVNEKEIESSVPIGLPITNSSTYILDKNLHPVPVGVQGELYCGGDGVGKGYLNRQELTKERFLPNPFAPGMIYRTGDLARYLPDGNIEFLGRTDNQVKIRGYRIELGEIEAVFSKHEKVADSLVVVRKDLPDKIVAYVLPQKGKKLEAEELRAYIASKLPDYMAPSFYIVLKKFPLKPNGKVNQDALPAPGEVTLKEGAVEPLKTATEKMVATIWANILQLPRVGAHDHFFRKGGDSLQAIQVLSELTKKTGKEIPPSAINQNPVLRDLATWIDQSEEAVEVILKRTEGVAPPLSFNQESLWLTHEMQPDSKAYLLVYVGEFEGKVDTDLLKVTLDQMIERHEILRTTFNQEKRELFQRIHSDGGSYFESATLTSEEAAFEWIQEKASEPIDLSKLPLFRFLLIKVSAKCYIYSFLVPHIIFDGWSFQVFFKEWEAFYQSKSLPELPLQYADYAAWQRECVKKEEMDKQLDYWVQKLKDAPELLEFPWDYQRPPACRFKGDVHFFRLEAPLATAILEKSKEMGVTLFEWLFSCFFMYLYRMTGKEEMVLGTPYANRGRGDLDQLVGYFVQMLMVYPDLTQEQTVAEFVSQIAREVAESYRHAEIPIEKIVNALNPSRHLSYNPLFQIAFSLEQVMPPPKLSGVKSTQIPWNTHAAMFDLYVTLSEDPEGIKGYVNYSTDLFKAETIHRFVKNFQVLLKAACEDSNQPIDTLPIMTDTELHQVTVEWNDTHRDYPRGLSLPTLFEQTASTHSEHIAIESELTYAELNEKSNQVGRHLQSLGVKKGALVGICLGRSVDLIVGILGILKTGATYVPINAEYPAERKVLMLDETEIVVTTSTFQEEFAALKKTVFCLDFAEEVLQSYSVDNLGVTVDSSETAVIHYTSGSTGKPKGVEVRHRGIMRMVKNSNWVEAHKGDHILHLADISFDVASFEIWTALLNGATLHLFPSKDIAIEELETFVQTNNITHVLLTARLFNLFVEHLTPPFKHLRFLSSVGEAMSVQHAQMALDKLPECSIVNGYGPTENGVITTSCLVNELEEIGASIPIGRPISNTQVYILDKHLAPVPIGVQGELYTGGDGLAKGYRNLEDLTQERFIPSPLGSGVLYQTGDLVRYLSDGNIEYLGRIDNQVKIRGYRIELGEIEATLAQHEKVADAFVMVREEPPGNKQMTAYVVPNQEMALTSEELKSYIAARLPAYMEPSFFVVLEQFPLKPNGKVDQKALPNPQETLRDAVPFQPPETPLEILIADIWATILHLDQVGRQDNFFLIGGHSIEAAELASLVGKALEMSIPMGLIIENATLQQYAKRIKEMTDSIGENQKPPITATELFWIWKNRESRLSSEITPESKNPPTREQYTAPKKILLTGATGFVGSFLLRELLDQTQAQIYCHVRASSDKEVMKRLKNMGEKYQTWDPALVERIVPLAGDLEKPLLGLTPPCFEELTHELDAIYHVGAYVNHALPYHKLKGANVDGTVEALRLACQGRTKPFHLISTASIFDMKGGEPILEDQDLNQSKNLVNGYAQSKWVSEKLAQIARTRGLPVNIFRLGRISGHSKTGESNASDFLWLMAEASLFINLAPDVGLKENVTPVDYVCKAIHAIASDPEKVNGHYHILNPQLFSYREIYQIFQSLGYPLKFVPYHEWKKALVEKAIDQTDERMRAILPLFSEIELASSAEDIIFMSDNTQNALKGTGIKCPEVDETLIKTYVDAFVKKGAFPPYAS